MQPSDLIQSELSYIPLLGAGPFCYKSKYNLTMIWLYFSHQNQLIQLPFEARNSKCISFPFNILHISRWRKSLSSKTSRRINDIMTGNCTLLDTYLLWQQLVTCDNSGIQYTAIIYLINTFCLEITGNKFIQFQSERNQLALSPNMCGFSLHHIFLA